MRTAACAIAAATIVRLALGDARAGRQPTTEESVTLVGAGDIANCDDLAGAHATARLLDRIDGTVVTLGDHAYPHGNAREFRDCYGATWGRHKNRTRPVMGNHDAISNHGLPFFEYFGEAAGPDRRGYYSFDLGAWHVIALNSNTLPKDPLQLKWLQQDLTSHAVACTLAYWHVPLFSSGPEGDPRLREVWHVLHDAGVDVVLNGHEHAYERFMPQDERGHADRLRGIREFIVGTGGGELKTIRHAAPNSEVWDDRTFGVLKLTLKATGYAWEFVPIAGERFRDAGEAGCSPLR